MSTASRTMTYADLDLLPDRESGERYEMLHGELIVTPSPIPLHQVLLGLGFRSFDAFVVRTNAGIVLTAPVDVVLAPGVVVVPDLLVIARHRLDIIGSRAIEGSPDLVLEIHSPSTRVRDLGEKKALYARFRVPEYWAVDPDARTVTVFALRDDRYEVIPSEGGRARSEVLPGFTLDINALFAAADL
jgi:Uma2 family endonuclease